MVEAIEQEKIRIVFIIDGFNPGGKERQVVELLRNLNRFKFELHVITYNVNQHYSDIVKSLVSGFYYIDKSKSKFSPFIKTFNLLKMIKPDIVHTWDLLADIYGFIGIKLLSLKYINGSIRDAGIEKGWQRKLKIFFLKHSDQIVSNSIAGLKVYNVKGIVLYNAIDLERFRKPYDGKLFNLIMVANFTDFKDQETFIKAALILKQKQIIDNVYLLGDGPNKDKILNLLKGHPDDISKCFYFPGAVYNVEEYLSKCKIGVLCSTIKYGEGVSNSVLEYLGAGLVPIVTNIGASKEIVEDGINGYLISAGGVEELVERVKNLKNDSLLYSKIRIQGSATLEQKFSYKKNVMELEELYSTINKK